MTELRVSPDLALPLDVVTDTFGILGKKGSGKSTAAVVLAEEMFAAGVPVVAIDPKGDWYGIRSSVDGKGPGLPIPVLGGRHGDIPLEPTAGQVIADLVLAQRLSCVLDVSEFSRADVVRFLLAFATRLYRQAEAEPLHLLLEESHEYLPQIVRADEAQLVGAWQRLVKQGRFKGIGVTLVSQRSAAVNKDVLEQVDNLIVMRTTGPRDRAAIKGWVDTHADPGEILSTLPSLASGEAWIWSPERALVKQFRFRRRQTFDSGATPKVGQAQRQPSTLADVDLGAIKDAMAETIERAKADDPKELRRQVATLKRELVEARLAVPEREVVVERVEVPVLGHTAMGRLQQILDVAEDVRTLRGDIAEVLGRWKTGEGFRDEERMGAVAPPRPVQRPDPAPRPESSRPPVAGISEGASLGKAERLILTALAQYPAGRTVNQVALLTGYAANGGGFRNPLSALRTKGWIEGRGDLRITDAGLAALGDWEPLPTGHALAEYWMSHPKLGHAEREILRVLIDVWPASMPVEQVAANTLSSRGEPYDSNGGGFRNPLSRLRTLELVEGRGELRASDDLCGT